jgi:hypothetical protein
MGFLESIRKIDRETVVLVIYALIPYVDTEIMGSIPLVRDVMPFVEPIYLSTLSWSELLRLGVLVVIPYVDGEVLELFGLDVREVIRDPQSGGSRPPRRRTATVPTPVPQGTWERLREFVSGPSRLTLWRTFLLLVTLTIVVTLAAADGLFGIAAFIIVAMVLTPFLRESGRSLWDAEFHEVSFSYSVPWGD